MKNEEAPHQTPREIASDEGQGSPTTDHSLYTLTNNVNIIGYACYVWAAMLMTLQVMRLTTWWRQRHET